MPHSQQQIKNKIISMLHLLACLTLEVGTMQIDQKLTAYPTDPIQQILDIAKVKKSEVADLRWDVLERADNIPIECDKLKPANLATLQCVLQISPNFPRRTIPLSGIQTSKNYKHNTKPGLSLYKTS